MKANVIRGHAEEGWQNKTAQAHMSAPNTTPQHKLQVQLPPGSLWGDCVETMTKYHANIRGSPAVSAGIGPLGENLIYT